ncbi:hypothetical protein ADUPG1_003457, partial [Aduncisulcus paluster]
MPDLLKPPFLGLFSSRDFAKFDAALAHYRAQGGKARVYSLIDLDVLSIYQDVCSVTLPTPESMNEEEARRSEDAFMKGVTAHFGSLSGLDALYQFEKLSLKDVSEKAVAIYVRG